MYRMPLKKGWWMFMMLGILLGILIWMTVVIIVDIAVGDNIALYVAAGVWSIIFWAIGKIVEMVKR